MAAVPHRTFIIAEAGVNHNGSLDIARKLVQAAAQAGADAIKFQTFRAETLAIPHSPKADYQRRTTEAEETQFQMLKRLELDFRAHTLLQTHCREYGITFLSSPFDLDSIDFLHQLGLDIFKIPSGEITNLPYLEKIGALRRQVILSTGMSTLTEIRAAVSVLKNTGTPESDLTLLHCNTEYPTPMQDVNLKAMLTIWDAFPKAAIGYSDHTQGIEVPIAAVAMGAQVIEKHFTLDRTMEGPDHDASLEPWELSRMIRAIRNIELALGDGDKKPSASEKSNILIARKSIVASKPIKRGEPFTTKNLAVKRPGNGISPMEWHQVLGQKSPGSFGKDEMIRTK